MAPAIAEPSVKYQPGASLVLTGPHPGPGPCSSGSLTGAVSSQSVTEECNGTLSPVGNRANERKRTRVPDCETHRSSRDESRR